MAPGMTPKQRAGFHAWNARWLRFHNVTVSGQQGPAFVLTEVADVEIGACSNHTPDSNAPVMRLEGVQGAFVHGCRAPDGTGVFVHLEGRATHDIAFAASDLSRTREPVRLGAGVLDGAILGL
jgi:hypothetical protein